MFLLEVSLSLALIPACWMLILNLWLNHQKFPFPSQMRYLVRKVGIPQGAAPEALHRHVWVLFPPGGNQQPHAFLGEGHSCILGRHCLLKPGHLLLLLWRRWESWTGRANVKGHKPLPLPPSHALYRWPWLLFPGEDQHLQTDLLARKAWRGLQWGGAGSTPQGDFVAIFNLNSVLSGNRPELSCVPWFIFFYPFTFNMVSLCLKYVSWRLHTVIRCFFNTFCQSLPLHLT